MRKIRIPRWIIIVSTTISALINLGFNMIVIAVFMVFNHVDLLQTSLWFPLILLEIYILGLGLSLFLAAAFVKYRDISYIWEVVMQAGFYVTPILYAMTYIKNVDYQKLLLMNPMAQAIQDARYALITHHPHNITIDRAFHSQTIRIVPIAICLIILVLGVLYFKKEAKHFAEEL